MDKTLDNEHRLLNGKWIQTYFNEDENEDSENESFKSISDFNNGVFKVYSLQGKIMLAGTYSIDINRTPSEIDWVDSIGDDAGKTFQAIYSLSKDSFKFCAADEGLPRPRSMTPKIGHTIREFKRAR